MVGTLQFIGPGNKVLMNRFLRFLFGGILVCCGALLFAMVSGQFLSPSSLPDQGRLVRNAAVDYVDEGRRSHSNRSSHKKQGKEDNVRQENETHRAERPPARNLTAVSESRKKQSTPQSEPESKIYPDWWRKSWTNSEVSKYENQFVGDKGLFPPCKHDRSVVSTYDFEEPQKYIPNSKNPCWYEQPNSKRGLKCLPYVYLAGVAKCGTSDITKRLRYHPEVFYGTRKEYHWWERERFGYYDEDDVEATVDIHDSAGKTFKEYLSDITGGDLVTLQKELLDTGRSKHIFGDFSPSYFWEPKNWYAINGNQGCPEPRVIVAQHIHHVYPDAKIMMIFRHPTPRLYSRFMSRIHRTSYLKKATTADFHRWVVEGVQMYNDCFKQHSVRRCAYNSTLYRAVMVRLVEGMYPVFMADWLRVWPRKQMLLMRYEDYAGHEAEHMARIFKFLGLTTLTKEQMAKVMKPDIVNAGTAEYEKYGGMLPETKQALDEFYRPFVQQFRDILNDDRFLWKDVYQES